MTVTADQLRDILVQACRDAGSQRAWAIKNEISPGYVNDCFTGRKEIGETIARALGYRPVTVYEAVRAGEKKMHFVVDTIR